MKPQTMGDLLSNMFLKCTLPFLSDGPVRPTEAIYCDQIGRALIEKLEFRVDENVLEVLENEKGLTYDVKTGLAPDELKKIIKDYDAIIIRSGTKLTKDILECVDKMKVIGRAGVGIDNVDLATASKKGIIVMNTPGGNTVSTCEHTIAMILALSRNIPQADSGLPISYISSLTGSIPGIAILAVSTSTKPNS